MTKVTRLTLDEGGVLERRRLHLREISENAADQPLDTVGADLRAARLRRELDIEAISDVLKIKPEHLNSLEEGDISSLPGRAYAIGFLRSYADFLGLDAAACIERFKTEIAGRVEPEEQVISYQTENLERRLPQGWIVFVVLALIAVVWGGYYLSVSANRMLSQNVTAVPPTLAQQTGVEQPRRPAASAPAPSQVVAALPPPATTVASAIKPPAVTPAVPPSTDNLPQGTQYGLMNKNYRLMLRVHKLTRLLVQGPTGTIYINRALQPGDTYQAPNAVGLLVTTGDADAVEVILDGESVGRLGKGTANGVSLNPQDIIDRSHRPG